MSNYKNVFDLPWWIKTETSIGTNVGMKSKRRKSQITKFVMFIVLMTNENVAKPHPTNYNNNAFTTKSNLSVENKKGYCEICSTICRFKKHICKTNSHKKCS